MPAIPCFKQPLSKNIHDHLWDWAQSSYALKSEWSPLWLNGLSLGRLNPTWKAHLLRDWEGKIEDLSDGIHLDTDNWPSMGNALQNLALKWKNVGLLQGWRDESFDVLHADGTPLFTLERSAFRPLGLQSQAVHLNGLTVIDGELHFWIGQRSPHKAVDPNKLDNIVGGGIASGEQVLEAMIRESKEEAGLAAHWIMPLQPRSHLRSLRPVSRGLHNEIIHIFDVFLPQTVIPKNQDGEVAAFTLMNLTQLMDEILSNTMMIDAQLVTLDAFSRYGLLNPTHPFSQWLAQLKIS